MRVLFAATLVGLLTYAVWMSQRIRNDPKVVFLTSDTAAKWIIIDDPIRLQAYPGGTVTRAFRCFIETKTPPTDATLHVRSLHEFNVHVDGRLVYSSGVAPKNWKTIGTIQLAPFLPPGRHELGIYARNENGPVPVWAEIPALGVSTDERWEGTSDGTTWRKVHAADARMLSEFSLQFESGGHALASRAPLFAALFAGIAAASFWLRRRAVSLAPVITPSRVRWFVLGVVALMGANNIFKLPAAAGADAIAHFEYMGFLVEKGRIPFANEGWQMFQSPLYYLISAPLFVGLSKIVAAESVFLWMRIVPLVCGLVQIELCYRTIRLIVPDRNHLQSLGVILAGLIPMNLYLSQFVGNEPMAGCLSSAAVYLTYKLIQGGDVGHRRTLIWVGIWLGLALLTKVSALLIVPPIGFALTLAAFSEVADVRSAARRAATSILWVGTLVAVIAGWYYIRNWVHLGRPFVGGWDASRGIIWWQDPGYRTWDDLFHFGAVFSRPIYASTVGLWDGLYASFWCDTYVASAINTAAMPKWNYKFLLSSVWWALIPTGLMAMGLFRTFRLKSHTAADRTNLFTVVSLLFFGFVFLHHYLTIPFHGVVKASYTLGLMPCYAVLGVLGLDYALRRPSLVPLIHASLGCWAFSVLGAYFII